MRVDLGGFILTLSIASTACAFRLMPASLLMRRVMGRLSATEYAQSGSNGVLSFYSTFFADCASVPGGDCIVTPVLKPRDMFGNTQLIDPLSFEAVDIDVLLHGATSTLNCVLGQSPFSTKKGALGAVRGVGGGKTLFMVKLQQQLCKPEHKHILPVLITFGGKWGDIDFQSYKSIFPDNPERAFSLAIISRIASVCFALPHLQIVDRIMKSKDLWQMLFEREYRGSHIALFLIYLAQKRDGVVTDIVLMVDEAEKGRSALTRAYQYNNNVDYTFDLHWAMLRHEVLTEYGMRGAYLESGLQHTVAMGNDAGPRSYDMLLPELLNATTVTRNLFLSDVDPDQSMHAVTPVCNDAGKFDNNSICTGNRVEVAFAWLCQVAFYYAHSPMALELAQDYLRRRVDRTTNPRTLVVSSSLVQGLFEYVETRLQETNPALYSSGAPTIDVLHGILLNQCTYARPPVFEGIRKSLYVNSLKRRHGFLPRSDRCHMDPRPTLQTLNAAVSGSPNKYIADTVEFYLCNLCKIYREYIVFFPFASRERTLSDLAAAWLQLLLSLAARTTTADENSIPVWKLLKTGSVGLNPRELPFTTVHDYLDYEISLPASGFIPMYTLQHSFSTTDSDQPKATVFDELNTLFLSVEVPCVVLKPVDGDCWGHGLAFLDQKNNSRIILLDTEIEESGDGSTGRCDAHYQRIQKVGSSYNISANFHGSGLGNAIAAGNYIFVCHTTTEGESFERFGASFVTLRANFLKRYYSIAHNPFLAIKGEENQPEVPECGDLRCTADIKKPAL